MAARCAKIRFPMKAPPSARRPLMSFPINLLLFLAVILASPWAQALTLGNLSGSALIGRTLNLTVQVRAEPGAASESQCTQVDVFHAENRLDRSAVQSSWQTLDTQSASGVLRILTTVPVDEPVVSVSIKAGCTDKTERKYVLLADMPTDLPSVASSPAAFGRSDRNTTTAAAEAPGVMPAPALLPAPRLSPATAPPVGMPASKPGPAALAPVPKSRPASGTAVATATVPAGRASGSVVPAQRPVKPPAAIAIAKREAPDVKPRLKLDVPPENIELSLKSSRSLVNPSEDGGQATRSPM